MLRPGALENLAGQPLRRPFALRRRIRRAFGTAIVATGLACALAACGSANDLNKEGTKIAARKVTLTMFSSEGPTTDTTYFDAQVAQRTHGQLRVVMEAGYSNANQANERRLAAALRENKVQMGYIPSRAWELDGRRVLDFRALQAPFLVTSYPLLRAVTTGGVAAQMLASLSRNGIVGLGLVPEELRLVLGRRPLVSASEFRGARLRVVASPTSVLVFRALGAIALTNITPRGTATDLSDGHIDGIESDPFNIANNSYVPDAMYLPSNVALFAKAETLVITEADVRPPHPSRPSGPARRRGSDRRARAPSRRGTRRVARTLRSGASPRGRDRESARLARAGHGTRRRNPRA